MQTLRYFQPAAVIQPGFSGLFVLPLSRNFEDLSMAAQPGTGLVEVEWYTEFHALQMGIQYPAVITDSGIRSGFSAAADTVNDRDVFFQKRPNVDGFQHGLMGDGSMLKGERQEDW